MKSDLLFAGEVVSPALHLSITNWTEAKYPILELFNLYGPTETNVMSATGNARTSPLSVHVFRILPSRYAACDAELLYRVLKSGELLVNVALA